MAGLIALPATTPDGVRAKAAALGAISDAGLYTGCCRADEVELATTFLKEIAGNLFVPLGEEAQQVSAADMSVAIVHDITASLTV